MGANRRGSYSYYSRNSRANLFLDAAKLQAVMKFLVLDLLGIYKAFLSPFLPPACRFEPTCSEYARQAVEKYGALRGTWMGLTRILRCQPLCKGGHDPVK
jgi:putative membrane protein insertion efficiency factor